MIPEENSRVSQSKCRDELKNLAEKPLTKTPQIPPQNSPQKNQTPKEKREQRKNKIPMKLWV